MNSDTINKSLPSTEEGERAILGAILLDNDVMSAAVERLKPEDFYSPENRRIFAAMMKLFAKSKSIDPILIGEEIKASGDSVESMGGVSAIMQLTHGLPHALNVEDYIKTVWQKSRIRNIIRTASSVTSYALAEEEDFETTVNRIEAEMFGVCENPEASRAKRLSELVEASLRRTQERIASGAEVVGLASGLKDLDEITGGWRNGNLIILGGRPSMGKAQPLDARILRADGTWTTMGNVSRGDALASIDGLPSIVTHIHPQGKKQIYRITLSDGRSTECCAEHLWRVHYRQWPRPRIVSILKVIEMLSRQRYQGRIWLDSVSGQFGTDVNTFVDPYVLGVLLGDGCLTESKCPMFTTDDSEVVEQMSARVGMGMTVVAHARKMAYRVVTTGGYRVKGSNRTVPNALTEAIKDLGLYGLKSHEKFVPCQYFSASFETRLALLRGLLDTDGWVETFGSVRFCTTSERLANDVRTLVFSLGGTATINGKAPFCTHKGERVEGLPAYTVNIQNLADLNLFAIKRKSDRLRQGCRKARSTIASVEPTRMAEAQCITVSHKDHLYVTDDYIATHNSAAGIQWGLNGASNDGESVVAYFTLEDTDEAGADRIIAQQGRLDLRNYRQARVLPMAMERALDVQRQVEHREFYIIDDPAITPMQLLAKCRRLKAEKKRLDLVVIDYLQLMSASRRSSSRQEEVSQITRELKLIARELDCPVIALSQLSREVEKRTDKRPIMSDLRESGSIEQDADVIVFVFREEYYNATEDNRGIAEFIIAKHKNGPTHPGVKVAFLKEFVRFENFFDGADEVGDQGSF